MTLTDTLKSLDDKIKANQAQTLIEKQLKFLYYRLNNWISMDI